MTLIRSRPTYPNWGLEVQKGNVPGQSIVHKYGRNDAIPNGSWAHVNLLGGALWQRTAAGTVRVKAGHASDTAGGGGAQAITIIGIDDNLVEVSESVATAGASASSATTALFWRVYRAYITPASAGAYSAANTGVVVIEDSGGSNDLISIGVEEGQSQFAAYTVPTGKSAYLQSAFITVDAGKAANIRLFTRANFNDVTTPFEPNRQRLHFDGVLGAVSFKPDTPLGAYPALTDIWWEAYGGGAASQVSVDFELLVCDA